MAGRKPGKKEQSKKEQIILLLKQGETSSTIIANQVGCGINYVFVVRRGLLRSKKA